VGIKPNREVDAVLQTAMSSTVHIGRPPPVSPEVRARLENDDLGSTIVGVTVSFTVLALTAVLLRFYTRVRLIKNFGAEDWLMLVSMVRIRESHNEICTE